MKTIVKFYDGAGRAEFAELHNKKYGRRFFVYKGGEFIQTVLFTYKYAQTLPDNEAKQVIDIAAIYTMSEDYHLVDKVK